MHRRLRVDVVERQRPLVLEDLAARDLAAQDLGEDVSSSYGGSPLAGIRSLPDRSGDLRRLRPKASGRARAREAFSATPLTPSRRFSSAQTSSGRTPASTHSTIRW